MSNLDDLTKLVELKEKGIITPEEFELQKTKLLSTSDNSQDESPKSRTVYGLLGFFLGWCGIHNFYLGRKIQGFFQALPLIIILIALLSRSGMLVLLAIFTAIISLELSLLWTGINLLATQKDGKKRKMRKNGKTLCIVLGILMIICSFSMFFGSLAGYTVAMNRHRANKIADYVARCAIIAQTSGLGDTLDTRECKKLLDNEPYPQGVEKAIPAGSVYRPTIQVKWDSDSAEIKKAFEALYTFDPHTLPHLDRETTFNNDLSIVNFFNE